jgi:arylformamidase
VSEPKLDVVSLPIHPRMIQWVGEEICAFEPLSRTPQDVANVTSLLLTTHLGTHVDPPRHFVHGAMTVDEVPLDRWVGPCFVADCTGAVPEIEVADLERAGIPDGCERLVLKTANSALWRDRPGEFVDTYVGVSLAAAAWIVARGIRLVGIDYLSVGPFHTTNIETHLTLLGNDVVIVEGLDLSEIVPDRYELLCFPLKIVEGDGAPARVALRGPLPD